MFFYNVNAKFVCQNEFLKSYFYVLQFIKKKEKKWFLVNYSKTY